MSDTFNIPDLPDDEARILRQPIEPRDPPSSPPDNSFMHDDEDEQDDTEHSIKVQDEGHLFSNPNSQQGIAKGFPSARRNPYFTRRSKSKLEQLPADSYNAILQYIRMGAYDHVAAKACGVRLETWRAWLVKGSRQKKGPYRDLYDDVMEARSQVRALCEMQVRKENPVTWLKNVAKTTEHEPGWTEQISIAHSGDMHSTIDVLHSGQVNIEAPLNDNTKAKSLLVMEECGLITLNPEMRKLLQDQATARKLGEVSHEGLDTTTETPDDISSKRDE